jgi:hypothetical protein
MVGSWRPTISEVHGLAPHGQAARSILVSSGLAPSDSLSSQPRDADLESSVTGD